MNDLNFISPEIFISLSIMFLLILGVFKKNGSTLIHNLSIGLLLITVILILNNPFDTTVTLFGNSYIIDNLSSLMKILTILGGAFVLSISAKYLKISDLDNSEKFILWSLAIPVLFFGFYPEPLINTIEVSVNNLIEMYNFNLDTYSPEVQK